MSKKNKKKRNKKRREKKNKNKRKNILCFNRELYNSENIKIKIFKKDKIRNENRINFIDEIVSMFDNDFIKKKNLTDFKHSWCSWVA